MLGFSVAIIHPQRRNVHYILDCLILMILSLILFSVIGYSLTHTIRISKEFEQVFFGDVALSLPLFYIVGLMVYWVIVKKKV